MHMLIFGHGYSAGALTPRLIADGWTVTGTTRRDGDKVSRVGAMPLIWPGNDAALRGEIARADAMLVSLGPDISSEDALTGGGAAENAADPVLRVFGDALRSSPAKWVGYLSSTSVYGDHGGHWIDEETDPNPSSPRAVARLAAEHGWTALAKEAGWPLTIFRLAGIYGPGRGPLAKLRSGTARRIVKPGQVFSRIHVDDIAGAVVASLKREFGRDAGLPDAATPRIFNLCDDDPAPPQDALAVAARMAGLPVPPAETFATADIRPIARSFYADSKRVRNDRMKTALGYELRYPDLRSGLTAILREEQVAAASGS